MKTFKAATAEHGTECGGRQSAEPAAGSCVSVEALGPGPGCSPSAWGPGLSKGQPAPREPLRYWGTPCRVNKLLKIIVFLTGMEDLMASWVGKLDIPWLAALFPAPRLLLLEPASLGLFYLFS